MDDRTHDVRETEGPAGAGGRIARFTPLGALLYPTVREVAAIFGGVSAALVAGALVAAPPADWWMIPAALVYGALWWSFIEYVFHRWVLHWEPASPGMRRVRKLLPGHRSHHNDPFDPDDVVNMKHYVGLAVAALCFAGMLLIGFPLAFALAGTAGGTLGYAAYEYVHFACHQLPMTSRVGRLLRQHHAIHHHRDETVNFGVTSPLWDHVFGTAFRPARLARPRRPA